MKEKQIEKAVCEYAKGLGWLNFKLPCYGLGISGMPDRMFMKEGFIFFIEFKSGGKINNLSNIQKNTIKKICKAGFLVFVVDAVESGKKLFNGLLLQHKSKPRPNTPVFIYSS